MKNIKKQAKISQKKIRRDLKILEQTDYLIRKYAFTHNISLSGVVDEIIQKYLK